VSGSGDIAFHPTLPGSPLYFVGETINGDAATIRLWTINLGTLTVSNVGPVTGLPNVANGIQFDNAGALLLSLTSQTRLYTAPIGGGASTPIGATGSMPAVFDLGGKDTVPAPDLSITKTDGRSFMSAGGPLTYTIVVTNNSTYAITGTVTDTVPATVTSVNWTCAASAGSTCAAASGTGNAINTKATLAAGGTATYTVTGTLSAGASGTLTNTTNVALPFGLLSVRVITEIPLAGIDGGPNAFVMLGFWLMVVLSVAVLLAGVASTMNPNGSATFVVFVNVPLAPADNVPVTV
jgi:uncharacterized repeat protein (TIGR01451 family)